VLGAAVGFTLGPSAGIFEPLGDLFIRLLMMASIPLIFLNLLTGFSGFPDTSGVGRIAVRIALYFVLTTLTALGLGLLFVHLFEPGVGFELRGEVPDNFGKLPDAREVLLGMVPRNAFAAFAEGRVTQVVVFAVLLGLAVRALPASQRSRVHEGCELLTSLMRRLVELILIVAPLGVAALAAVMAGRHGADMAVSLAKFATSVWTAQAALVGMYLLLLYVLAGKRPVQFLRESYPVIATAAATASSLATLPVSLDVAEKRLRLPRHVSAFVLPLGAQLNKDGTSVFLSAVLLFTAQAAGVELGITQIILILLIGLLLSEGSNGVPGGGLVIAFIFVEAFHLPVEIVAMVAGIFHLIDVGNTTINCVSDLVAAVLVAHYEPEEGEEVGRTPPA
jgi:Na+/H+-dicarboxylate symporter